MIFLAYVTRVPETYHARFPVAVSPCDTRETSARRPSWTILDFNVMKGLSHASASYIVNNYPQARHSIFDTKRLPVRISVPSRRSYRKVGNCEHIVVLYLTILGIIY